MQAMRAGHAWGLRVMIWLLASVVPAGGRHLAAVVSFNYSIWWGAIRIDGAETTIF